MKHSDALTKICPFATMQHVPQPKQSAVVDPTKGPEIVWGTLSVNCMGERCMAWTSAGEKEFSSDGYCAVIFPDDERNMK